MYQMEGKQGKTQHEYLWLENVFLKNRQNNDEAWEMQM